MPEDHKSPRAKKAGFELSGYTSFFPGSPYDVAQTKYGYTWDSGGKMVPLRREQKSVGQGPMTNIIARYNLPESDNGRFFVQGLFATSSRGEEDDFFHPVSSNADSGLRNESLTKYNLGLGMEIRDKSGLMLSSSVTGGIKVFRTSTDFFLGDEMGINKFVIPNFDLNVRAEKDMSDKFSFYGEVNMTYNTNYIKAESFGNKWYDVEVSPMDIEGKLGASFKLTDHIEVSAAAGTLAGFRAKYRAFDDDNMLERNTGFSRVPVGANVGVKVKF